MATTTAEETPDRIPDHVQVPTKPHILALVALRDPVTTSIDQQFAADSGDNHEKKMETAAIAVVNAMRPKSTLKTVYENRELLSAGPLQNTVVNIHLLNNVQELLATTTSYQKADAKERAIMEDAFNSNRGNLMTAFSQAFFRRLEERASEIPEESKK